MTTGVTLACLVVLLCGMSVWGYHQLTKPLPKLTSSSSNPANCSKAETSVQRYVRRSEITVSVFNAGARKGFAGLTLTRLENLGFHPGAVANAPHGTTVSRAVVYTTQHDDQSAELVARTLGKQVPVRYSTTDYGPGVDVFVGPHQHHPDQHAPKRIKLDHPITTCVPVS